MEDSVDTDWSVVAGKKEKKASPKTHNKKSLKRGELQRSTSSNQLNSRRKLGVTPQNNISTAKGSDGLLSSSQKGVINKKMGNIGDSSTESAPIAHDPIPDIVEDVSLSIKRLSIDNLQMVDRAVDFKSAALRNNDDHVQEIESFSDAEFCELCRNYYSAPPDPVKSFSARYQFSFVHCNFAVFFKCAIYLGIQGSDEHGQYLLLQ